MHTLAVCLSVYLVSLLVVLRPLACICSEGPLPGVACLPLAFKTAHARISWHAS